MFTEFDYESCTYLSKRLGDFGIKVSPDKLAEIFSCKYLDRNTFETRFLEHQKSLGNLCTLTSTYKGLDDKTLKSEYMKAINEIDFKQLDDAIGRKDWKKLRKILDETPKKSKIHEATRINIEETVGLELTKAIKSENFSLVVDLYPVFPDDSDKADIALVFLIKKLKRMGDSVASKAMDSISLKQ